MSPATRPSGDPARAERLWNDFAESLGASFRARGARTDDVPDLVSETFVRVQGALDTLRDDERAGAWVGRIARHVWIDALRRRALPREEAVPEELPESLPEDALPVEGFARWLRGTIDELDPDYAVPLRRFDVEGASQAAIAAELGLSLPALKSRILRGREQVRARFDRCCTLVRDRRGGLLEIRRNSDGRDCAC
jgi:RNA polymerase sigma-70 factor (ECF subfamily)